jgi:hypothetical protein
VNRSALEHLLRAAAAITGEQLFYVVGTAAIVPSLPEGVPVPYVLERSREADLIPASNALRSIDLIDGALGQDSIFDGTFGYHADGVEFATVSYAPKDWQQRTIRFSTPATNGAVGMCMEPHDLAIAKLCAGRDKDLEFVQGLIETRLLDGKLLTARLRMVSAPQQVLQLTEHRLASLLAPKS